MTKPRRLISTIAAAVMAGLFVSLVGFQALLVESPVGHYFIGGPVPAFSWHGELPPPRTVTGPAKHVLVISVDGLRPDAIAAAQAPVLTALMKRGARAQHAETIRPSITLPSHTAMLTGLDFGRHGVVWNNYRPGHIPHPTLVSVASRAGLSTAMLFAKDKFHYLADPDQVHWIYGPGIPRVIPKLEDVTRPDFKENTGPDPSGPAPSKSAASTRTEALPESKPAVPATKPVPGASKPTTSADGIARAFSEEWPRAKYQVTFIHFAEPDGAGHGRGWMTRPYLDAVLKVDAAIGKILETIEEAGERDATAVIVSADHGGLGRQHYFRTAPDTPENVTIPWICAGPGVIPGTVVTRPIRTMDTTPTALRFLGLPVPEGLDGVPVREVLPAEGR